MNIKKTLILTLVFFSSFSLLNAQTVTIDGIRDEEGKTVRQDYSFKGLYNTTTIGILSGSSQNRQAAPFSFQSLMMYSLNEHFALGAGFGVEFLEETYVPIVADIRYYVRGSRFSPFVFLQSGYSLATDKSANSYIINDHYDIWPGPYPQPEDVTPLGGFVFNPGFGVRHMFHPDFGLEISFSYRYQKLNYESLPSTRLENTYNRLNLRIGILFK